MKNLMLSTVCILASFSVFCQIPNPSFEEWEQIDNYDKPVDWGTNQDTDVSRIIQDSIFKIDGEYSMHFISQLPMGMVNCESRVSTSFNLIDDLEENQSLYFYLKLLSVNPDDDVSFAVQIAGYKNGLSLGSFFTSYTEEYEEFEQMEIPIPYIGADKLVLNFLGGGNNGLSNGFWIPCFKRSVSWLDGLEIRNSSTTSIRSVEKEGINIYPNPSFGKIEIKGDWEKYQSYEIYNLLGKKMERGILESSNVTLKTKGIIFLILKSNTGNQSVFKIINR